MSDTDDWKTKGHILGRGISISYGRSENNMKIYPGDSGSMPYGYNTYMKKRLQQRSMEGLMS